MPQDCIAIIYPEFKDISPVMLEPYNTSFKGLIITISNIKHIAIATYM